MERQASDVIIRRANIDDIEDTVNLWVKFSGYVNLQQGREEYSPKAPSLFRDYILNHIGHDDHILLVAEAGGELVGFAEGLIQKPHPMFEQDDFVELYHIYVRQAYRKQNVGRKLLQGVEEWAQVRSIRRLHLSVRSANELGHRFWLCLGFEDYAHVMHKVLTG